MYNTIFLISDIVTWLLEQAPVVIIMGAVIYWLQAKLIRAEEEKDSLARDVIQLTTLWEEKSQEIEDTNEKSRQRITELLNDIKTLILNRR